MLIATFRALTGPEKTAVVLFVVGAAIPQAIGFDVRWNGGCSAGALIAAVTATVAYLKGREGPAAAGVWSVIAFGGLVGWIVVAARTGENGEGAAFIGAFILLFATTFVVLPMLLVSVVGSLLPARPESPWAERKRSRRAASSDTDA